MQLTNLSFCSWIAPPQMVNAFYVLTKNEIGEKHRSFVANLCWEFTHAKIIQLVASVQSSHPQIVFAQLVTSCRQ